MSSVVPSASAASAAARVGEEPEEVELPMSEEEFRRWCEKHSIACEGILMLTIQRNRAGEFVSLIYDWENHRILPVYPQAVGQSCKHVSGLGVDKEIIITCHEKLPRINDNTATVTVTEKPFTHSQTEVKAETAEDKSAYCCSAVTPYKPTHTSLVSLFSDSIKGSTVAGSHTGYILEIKRQINHGPLVNTRYFRFDLAGHLVQVEKEDTNTSNKVHVFKNYVCKKHNLFFGVDVFKENSSSVYNLHHMRPNPFTNLKNKKLIQQVFKEQ